MQTNTTAVVIAHNGAQWLSSTLTDVQRQGVDNLIVVDAGSTDDTTQIISGAGVSRVVVVPGTLSFAANVQRGLDSLGRQPGASDFIWILHDDSAPGPAALERMLQAAERNSNAAVFGPKLYSWDTPGEFQSFGVTMTRTGVAVNPARGEQDQAQFDDYPDTMAVSTAGMLVRWEVWNELQGLDPALSYTDDGLDFGVRARLAGYRVVRVADAAVRHAASAPRGLARHEQVSGGRRVRAAQLYRHFVYARAVMLPLLMLGLIPITIARSIWQLLTKRPKQVFDEWAATAAMFTKAGAISKARGRLVRNSSAKELGALRMSPADYRQLQAQVLLPETQTRDTRTIEYRPFWNSSGPWVVGAAAVASIVMWWQLLSAQALSGGGLNPLSGTPSALVENALHYFSNGVTGSAFYPDPATWMLALLGSITFWHPALSVVWLWLLAMPLAAFGAFMAAGVFTTKSWTRSVVAVIWTLLPTFLFALSAGKLFAVVAHLLLPLVVRLSYLAMSDKLSRPQRITAVAGASLSLGVATISSPLATAAAVVLSLVAIAIWPRRVSALVWLPVPGLVFAAPNIVQAVTHNNFAALLTDGGISNPDSAAKLWQAALGLPTRNPLLTSDLPWTSGLWRYINEYLPLLALLVSAIMLIAVVVALIRGYLRIGLIGLGGIVIASLAVLISARISVTSLQAPSMWSGIVVSMSAALAIPAVCKLFNSTSKRMWPHFVVLVLVVAQATPWAAAVIQGDADVQASSAQRVPAIVAASETDTHSARVLSIESKDGVLEVTSVTAAGPVLDATNAANNARSKETNQATELSNSVAGLVLGSDAKAATAIRKYGFDFVLVSGEITNRQVQTISSASGLSAVGLTDYGYLWQVTDSSSAQQQAGKLAVFPVILWALTLLVLILLAIPTSRLPWRAVDHQDLLADETGPDAADPYAEEAVELGGRDE